MFFLDFVSLIKIRAGSYEVGKLISCFFWGWRCPPDRLATENLAANKIYIYIYIYIYIIYINI